MFAALAFVKGASVPTLFYGRLHELPPAPVDILKHGNPAVRLTAWLVDELDTSLHVGRMITREVICLEKEKDPASTLLAHCPKLAITDRPR